MTLNSSISRRAVLAAGAAGAGAAALAACSSGRGPADGGAAKNQVGLVLTKLADVPVGHAVAVQLPDGSPVIVARPTASAAACFSAICTHQGCTVAPQGDKLNCPCHGSQFNAMTGAVLSGPASTPLHRIGVKVAGGKVVTV